jgi:hypothetical protein
MYRLILIGTAHAAAELNYCTIAVPSYAALLLVQDDGTNDDTAGPFSSVAGGENLTLVHLARGTPHARRPDPLDLHAACISWSLLPSLICFEEKKKGHGFFFVCLSQKVLTLVTAETKMLSSCHRKTTTQFGWTATFACLSSMADFSVCIDFDHLSVAGAAGL